MNQLDARKIFDDVYNCSGNYGQFLLVKMIDYRRPKPHSTDMMSLHSKICDLIEQDHPKPQRYSKEVKKRLLDILCVKRQDSYHRNSVARNRQLYNLVKRVGVQQL